MQLTVSQLVVNVFRQMLTINYLWQIVQRDEQLQKYIYFSTQIY